jgi:hypothetical protein
MMDFYPGQTICYHMRQFALTYYMPALYHGPCPDIRHGNGRSSITILARGRPKRMDWVKNTQLMSLAEYWRISGRRQT